MTTQAPYAPPPPAEAVKIGPLHGPWPSTTFFRLRWPGPARPAGPGAVLGVLAAAAVAALSIPLDRPGVGWLITALAGVAALVVGRAVPGRSADSFPGPSLRHSARPARWDRFAWTAATVALLGVGTLRAAGWLFVLCLLTATLTGTLALGGGNSIRAIAVFHLLSPAAAVRAVPWLGRGAARLRRRNGNSARIAATAAVSVALLLLFGALFASADAAFARILGAVAPDIDLSTLPRWVFVFTVTTLALGGAAFLRAAAPDLAPLDRAGGRTVGRAEWAVPLSLLVLLFGAFVAVQLTVLFGGSRHVLRTEGLTYAEYARSGFWQLSVVTGLVLVVLAGAARWAPRTSRADRMALRLVLGALTVLTLVIVASALHRMSLYTETYGLTRLRLLVACCEAWFGLVLVWVLVAGVRIRAPWLPRVAIATGVLTLLALAVANPDARIAEHNVQRFNRGAQADLNYLAGLSPDAAPAVAELADPVHRVCLLQAYERQLTGDDWRGWNLGRRAARAAIAANPVPDISPCRGPAYYGY